MAVATPCGTNRCGNERKQLRKELERGRKNLIAYIGLECVVESLFGEDFFKKISPFRDDDDDDDMQIGEDWKGEEKCLLCKARSKAVEDTIAQHQAYIDKLECGLVNGRGRPEHTSQQQRLLRAEQWLATSVNDIHTHKVEYDSDGDQNQPLDLSRQGLVEREASVDSLSQSNNNNNKQHMLKVPSVTVHRPTKNKMGRPCKGYGSASYTQDDLKLALQEVRSGKVGTRRAAMLFGIPRSTIRNHLNRHSFLVVEDEDMLEGRTELAAAGKGAEDDNNHPSERIDEGDDLTTRLRSFLVNRTIPVRHLDEDLENGLSQEILQDLVASCIRLSLVAGMDSERANQEIVDKVHHESEAQREASLPQHLIKTLVHCHLVAERDCARAGRKASAKQPGPPALPDLKIPLYKPMSADGHDSDEENGNDKSVSPDDSEGLDWRQNYGLNLSGLPSSPQVSSQRSTCSQDSSSKRPKRGRYRCYDRDCLMQAVNAVQRGEMTVTRAGNVFGVPHSTLEYKVKERHLKRLSKRVGHPKIKTEYESSGETNGNAAGLPGSVYQQQEGQSMSAALHQTHRPFESFAERLRAMSEKQAMQNSFSFLKQGHAGASQPQQQQQPTAYLAQTLLAPGLTFSPDVTDKCYLLDGQHAAAALASHSLGLAKQWIGWPVHPAFKTVYPQIKDGMNGGGTPAVLYAAAPDLGVRNSSVSDAINRLVEAQIYDSLYGGGEAQQQQQQQQQAAVAAATTRAAAKVESASSNFLERSIREALDSGPSTSKQEDSSPRSYASSEGSSKKRPRLSESQD